MSAPVTGRWRHEKQGQFCALDGELVVVWIHLVCQRTVGCWTKWKMLLLHENVTFHMAETEIGK